MNKKIGTAFSICLVVLIFIAAVMLIVSNSQAFTNDQYVRIWKARRPFTASACIKTINASDKSKLGIQESRFLKDTNVLAVRAYVATKCDDLITKGDYKLNGTTIVLNYKKVAGGSVCAEGASNICAHELLWLIPKMEEKEYKFVLNGTY